MPEMTKKDLLREAHREANEALASKRIEVLKALKELDELRGDDDYALSLERILNAFGGSLELAIVTQLLPDSQKLSLVRRKLKDEGRLEEFKEKGEGTKVKLRWVNPAE